MRVGIGYDAHRFKTGRRLFVGGVEIPFEKGLDGHSDADVLIHAICDALLGAAGMGDIGTHFPDTEEKWKGAPGAMLLGTVCGLLKDRGFEIANIDSVVIAQNPKLNPYIDEMKNCLAKVSGLDKDRIGIKATTTEKLGFEGREEGMAAHAVALIRKT